MNLKESIQNQKWRFAKTWAHKSPHEYILHTDNNELYETLMEKIKVEGYDFPFTLFGHTKIYRCLDIEGFRYWGYPIMNGFGIVNRTWLDKAEAQRAVDDYFSKA